MKKKLPGFFNIAKNSKLKSTKINLLATLKSLTIILTFCSTFVIQAQGPGSLFVNAGEDQVIACGAGSTTQITANFLEIFETVSEQYTVASIPYNPPFAFNGLANSLNPNIDDAWSPVDDLPFDFCFFGNLEQQFQVGSNGVLRFDVDPLDTTNGWSFTQNLPNNTNPTLAEANIFTPVHDIDPSASTTEEIGYEVLGEFPNRVLVVSYFQVPMFSGACNSLLATHMAVFYEFSNVIEIYMQDKPVCPTWNSGNAALGIQNNAGTIAYVPPGRNTSDSPWTATNEAWQFAPQGLPTYVFEWVDSDGNFISSDPTITVSPDVTETFTARVTYTNGCNGDVVVLEDTVTVFIESSFTVDLGEDQSFCNVASFEIVPTITGVDPAEASYLWSTGETTPTITVSVSGTYSVDVTFESCTVTDSITLEFEENPIVDLGENFGTCFESPVFLDATPSNYNPEDVTFAWTLNGASLGLTTAVIEAQQYGTYSVVVTFGDCTATDSITLEVGENPIVDLGENFETCFDSTIFLDATPSNYNPEEATFEWFLNGASLGFSGAVIEALDYGTYNVVVTFGDCVGEDSVAISPRGDLQVSLGENISGCLGESVTITATTAEAGVTYSWFLNGNLIVGENSNTITVTLPLNSTSLSDIYSVQISKGECTGSAEIEALALNCVITQGISPNGDGLNDCFDVEFLNNRSGIAKLSIFNRYGTIVFESENYTKQWCGDSENGDTLPTGTYFYVMNFANEDATYGMQTTGWVYLNRNIN